MTIVVNDSDARTHKSRWLLSDLRFETPADAKLAALFLENDFPIKLFQKVFDLIVDPDFKREDITFEDIWDFMENVSSRRRKISKKREAGPAGATNMATTPTPSTDSDSGPSSPAFPIVAPTPVPPLVVDLVGQYMVDTSLPLSAAAMGSRWAHVFRENGSDFWNMSLVHRSWTLIAQSYLRRRAVIPYQSLRNFLVSPHCGPWITEIILYWTIDDGPVSIEIGDIWMFEALLSRTPNLRALVLNTFFYGKVAPTSDYASDLRLIFEIIADVVPNLESLYLNHLPVHDNDERICGALRSLFSHLPKMTRLKYLGLKRWGNEGAVKANGSSNSSIDWSTSPPISLKTLELYIPASEFDWLLKPRNEFHITSLTLTPDKVYTECLGHGFALCASKLRRLTLCPRRAKEQNSFDVVSRFTREILPFCTSLRTLHVFDGFAYSNRLRSLRTAHLPPSLTDVYIHRTCSESEPQRPRIAYGEEAGGTKNVSASLVVSQPAINLRRVHLTRSAFPQGFEVPFERPFLEVDYLSQRAESQISYEAVEKDTVTNLAGTDREMEVLQGIGFVPENWKPGTRLAS